MQSGFLSSVDGVNDIPIALRPVLAVFSRSDKHYIFNNNPQIQNLLATPAQYLQSSRENLDTATAVHTAACAATTAAVNKLKDDARTRYDSALMKTQLTNPATMQLAKLDKLISRLKQPSAKTKSRDLNTLISIL